MPLIIQTKVRTSQRSGKNLLIEPKETTSPRGSEKMSVRINSLHVAAKPTSRFCVTSRNKSISNPLTQNPAGQNPAGKNVVSILFGDKVYLILFRKRLKRAVGKEFVGCFVNLINKAAAGTEAYCQHFLGKDKTVDYHKVGI